MNIGALIPIRLKSERLPGKALMPICGRPVVYHLLDRVCASKYIGDPKKVVVCTTRDASDDPLVEAATKFGASVFRGSTDDIIRRFHDAIAHFALDAVIQADGDDPLTDTFYMDRTMETLLGDSSLGIVTCEKLPLGVASKSFTRAAMEAVFKHYKSGQNDTGFIYFFTKTGLCKMATVSPASPAHIHDEIRLTLDYEEDLALFRHIFEALYREGQIFQIGDVIALARKQPELLAINGNLNEGYWQRTRDKAKLEYLDATGQVHSIPV
jgi:spore coat polysaccharide biosynthesis protein SpsF (cytidylyltransferase family)